MARLSSFGCRWLVGSTMRHAATSAGILNIELSDDASMPKQNPATLARRPSEISKALLTAQRVCTDAARRLTPIRRDVYALLLKERRPMSAYELLSALEKTLKRKLAPLTVYRALDFLIEAGLAHRLERSHAFVACQHPSDEHESLYLVCSACGLAEEVESAKVADVLTAVSRKHGFRPEQQIVEVRGVCEDCTRGATK